MAVEESEFLLRDALLTSALRHGAWLMPDDSQLPPDLLSDFTDPQGRKVTLVIGAGCSFEPPTNLPLSKNVSRNAHQQLLDDGVLQEPCENPEDLSEVADAVFEARGEQRPLVKRMGIHRFTGVDPNSGHKIAAALLREECISSVITLNYDDAMTQAMGYVGGREEINEIGDPRAHNEMGSTNLVYLHRKADADPNDLIIRTEDLENEWEGNWEEMIVQSQLIRSSSVFAGLGSPAAVLTESTQKLRGAEGSDPTFYQVDTADYEWENDKGETERSPFTEALDIPEDQYIQSGWCDFMEAVGERVRKQQLQELCEACVQVALEDEQQLFEALSDETLDELRSRIRSLLDPGTQPYRFLEMGKLRARWFLETGKKYACHFREDVPTWIAQLLLAVDYILRRYEFEDAIFLPQDGCVKFCHSDGREIISHLAHGRSRMSWKRLQNKLPSRASVRRERTNQPICILAEGLRGSPEDYSTPQEIGNPKAGSEGKEEKSILESSPSMTRVEAYHLHRKTDKLDQVFEP